MELLPSADYPRLIAQLVADTGGRPPVRCEVTSDCHTQGPCVAHPDRGVNCRGAKGVSYHVFEGSLRGDWCSWGEGAEQRIFDDMARELNEQWTHHLRQECGKIGRALRKVGR